jgi:hypothetical protein
MNVIKYSSAHRDSPITAAAFEKYFPREPGSAPQRNNIHDQFAANKPFD